MNFLSRPVWRVFPISAPAPAPSAIPAREEEDTGEQQADEGPPTSAPSFTPLSDHIVDFDLAFGIFNDNRCIVDFLASPDPASF